jgi:C1A family cysteine protease
LFYSSGVYKHTTGGEAGGHAVSIVGYNDNDRAWIVRNSWGPDWGENGFVRVSYDDVSGVSSNTWQYILPKTEGYVSLSNPRNRDFLAGTAHLQASSTFANTSSVDVNITSTNGKSVSTVSCQTANCSMDVDTNTLKDGTYDAVAVAHVGTQTEQSQHEVFYIVNKAPTMSLSFTGQSDLTKPLNDRVVFNLAPVSSSVPFSSLVFHVAQNGTDVYSKAAEIVVAQGMTMGWRTGSVPNGTYDIYFTGQIAPEGLAPYTATSSHMTVTVKN